MRHLQGGVRDEHGKPIPTKKALREAVGTDTRTITFYDTSAFNRQPDMILADLPEDVSLTVVGPDPYQKRQWFATVRRHGPLIQVT